MIVRNYSVGLTVSAPGPEDQKAVTEGPFDISLRKKQSARLGATDSDSAFYYDVFMDKTELDDGRKPVRQLSNPSAAELGDTIGELCSLLSNYEDRDDWKGGELSLSYSGHGLAVCGAWVLKDGVLQGTDLVELLNDKTADLEGRVGVDVTLDSCYAASFAIDMITAQEGGPWRFYDCWCSSLHDEESWELEEQEQGLFTYTRRSEGWHPDISRQELARAVEIGDGKVLRLFLQSKVPNSCSFLSGGTQHRVDIVNGQAFDVKGGGKFHLGDVGLKPGDIKKSLGEARASITSGAGERPIIPAGAD